MSTDYPRLNVGHADVLSALLDRNISPDDLHGMPATVEQLTIDALALSESDRACLAQTLLRSLEPALDANVEEAWSVEIGRRLDRVRQGTARGRPADEVFRDIRARYQK